jgi:hypothetical protein
MDAIEYLDHMPLRGQQTRPLTKSSRPSARAAWARCNAPATPTLNRDVAIKVLPATLAGDTQYMARFERKISQAGAQK